MANEKKITKREKNELAIAILNGRIPTEDEKNMLIEHFTHENEILARKNSKSATLTPAQKDALAVGEIIRDILAECTDENGMTVGALLKHPRITAYVKADGNGVSSQMVTSIFTKNPKDFKRTVVKKVAYYSIVYGVDEGEGED